LDERSTRRKASTYTGQHNTERRGQTSMLSGIRTHDPSNQPAKNHASDRTATVTGINKSLALKNQQMAYPSNYL
jgi:hypothetical protein